MDSSSHHNNGSGFTFQGQSYYPENIERGNELPFRGNENYRKENMEWDSTFEEPEFVGLTKNPGEQYDNKTDDYEINECHYRHDDDRRQKGDYENLEDKKIYRDRDKDDVRERERDVDRELERMRYGERSERGMRGRERERSWDGSKSRDRDRSWERSKDRGRDRDRDRDRERERDKGKERDRDRDRDRERIRARERDLFRERDRERRKDERNDRDRDYDERYSRDRRRNSADRDRDYEKEKVSPSAHIMIRGSPSALTKEDEIAEELFKQGLEYQDIKIVRNRHGESRGFGFVDFYDVATAEKWMGLTKGVVYVSDYRLSLEYSKTRTQQSAVHQIDVDWYCSKCRTLNYASRKRVACFSCGEQRKDFPPDGQDDYDYDENGHSKNSPICAPPYNVLMMRGLDTNTTEEVIRNSLVELTSVPIYDVRLIKDKVTSISRGFCFIELGSIEDATSLLEKIQQCDPAYFVEGRRVSVGYARNTPHPPSSKGKLGSEIRARIGKGPSQETKNVNIASVAIAQAQAAQLQGQAPDYNYQSQQSHQYAQAVSGSQHATGAIQSYGHYGTESSQAASQAQQEQQVTGQQTQQQQYAKPQNAMANYTYDPTTGYYYDPSTGLYYDANTGYYYNSATGRFLYWDPQKQQYFIVNQDGSLSSMDSDGNPVATQPTNADKVKSKPTGSSARKIAKDMERWAKKMNEAKVAKSNAVKQAQLLQRELEAKEEAIRKQIQTEIMESVAMQKPDAITISKKTLFTAEDEDGSQSLAALIAAKTDAKASSLVAEYGDDSDDDQSDKHIDWDKLTCLLCKRQFPNRDILTKHQQFSDLHKQNLQKYKQRR